MLRFDRSEANLLGHEVSRRHDAHKRPRLHQVRAAHGRGRLGARVPGRGMLLERGPHLETTGRARALARSTWLPRQRHRRPRVSSRSW